MMHILTDSASLISPSMAEQLDINVIPLQVMAGSSTYKDNVTITLEEMVRHCQNNEKVSTSQPAIAEKIDAYNQALEKPEDTVIDLTMADGLSGTYQSALMAKEQCDDPSRVTVINTKCLGGPQQALVQKAVRMKNDGYTPEQIASAIERDAASDVSTVSVQDFHFLQRSGRVSKGLAMAGSMLRLIPSVLKTDDGTTLEKMGVSRCFSKAFEQIVSLFEERGVNEDYRFYILHGLNEEAAKKAEAKIRSRWPHADVEVLPLCPMFLVHGGPGCISLQAIRIQDEPVS